MPWKLVLDSANENGLDKSSPLLQPLTNPGVLRHAPDWLATDPDRRTDMAVILDGAGTAVNGMVLVHPRRHGEHGIKTGIDALKTGSSFLQPEFSSTTC